jgi:hypothetical protein
MTLYSALLTLLIVACQVGMPMQSRVSTLTVEAPSQVRVGQPIQVTVGPVNSENGTYVGLMLVGSHGPFVDRTAIEAGMAYFTIPAGVTRQPGHLVLIAVMGDARGEADIDLLPSGRSSASVATPPDVPVLP